jgi:hypothetical protein
VSGPFSDPGGQYSHAVSAVCGVVECPWAYLGSRAIGSARWDGVLPRASGSRVASAASPGHSPRRAASGIRSAPRQRLWRLRRAAPMAVVSGLTDGPTGVWLGRSRARPGSRWWRPWGGGSCGIRVCGLPPWSQVPKPPRHSAGAAKRSSVNAVTLNYDGGNKTITGTLTVNGEIWLKNDMWHRSAEGAYMLYFGGGSGVTYLAGENTDSGGICTQFMSGPVSGYKNLKSIYNHGNVTINDSLSNDGFLLVYGSLACRLFSVSSTNTDMLEHFGTFTGFQRCFTDDELYNHDDRNKFKDDYVGRIVISNGKIATEISNDQNEWNIFYDQDGITPEDAVPMIQLSGT